MAAKIGEKHHKATLTDEEVRDVRYAMYAAHKDGRKCYKDIGYSFVANLAGCSTSTVRDLWKGYSRVDAGGPMLIDGRIVL